MNHIKPNPKALYVFFQEMPKGGELHYHLSGGTYAEAMLKLAAKGGYCLNTTSYVISKGDASCNGVSTKTIIPGSALYKRIIKDWSMQDFTPGKESGHDHFFNSFVKYTPIVMDYRPELLVDIINRAARQNESYLEILDMPDDGKAATFAPLIKNTASLQEKTRLLLNNPQFIQNVQYTATEANKTLARTRELLRCQNNPQSKACQIKIAMIAFVFREQTLNAFFAQALNAFAAVSQSQGALVGVNLVQPEDGELAVKDYHQHMQILSYLHKLYPNVSISLHAGELTSKIASAQTLSDHIQTAILTGQAQRIGHGVDIRSERDAEKTVKMMAEKPVPVEINLISNLKILGVSGDQHPLRYYLAHKVPVVLSTDDEGVLRTDLTSQYVEAVRVYGLDYATIKQINRNSLTYAFVAGQSLWANPASATLRPVCQNLNSKSCLQFIKNNEKARLQWNLEKKLQAFDKKYASPHLIQCGR